MDYFANRSRLKNNVSYFGIHKERSTAVAKWDSRKECFWYISLAYSQRCDGNIKTPD